MVSRLKHGAYETLHLRNRTVHRRKHQFRKSRTNRHIRCPKCTNKPNAKICTTCQSASSVVSKRRSRRVSGNPVSGSVSPSGQASCSNQPSPAPENFQLDHNEDQEQPKQVAFCRTRRQKLLLQSSENVLQNAACTSAMDDKDVADGRVSLDDACSVARADCPPSSRFATLDHLPITWLPLHLQQLILEYLPLRERVRNEMVCRSWMQLLRSLWYTKHTLFIPASVQTDFNIRKIDERHVCGILRKCGKYLQRISFFFLREQTGMKIMDSIVEECENLRQFSLSTDVPCPTMFHLLRCISIQLPQLQLLDINYHLEQVQNQLLQRSFENGLRACVRRLDQLRSFNMSTFVMPLNPVMLFPESQHIQSYSLYMLQVRNATIEQGQFVPSPYVTYIFQHLADNYPDLHNLGLSIDSDYQVDETEVYTLMCRLGSEKRIKSLSLRITYLFEQYNMWFGSQALRSLCHWTSLQDLTLWACYLPIDFAQLLEYTRVGSRLQRLSLDAVYMSDAQALHDLFAACPNLTHLSLVYHNNEHCPSPAFITAPLLTAAYMYCGYSLQSLELVDCDHVNLQELILSTHAYMHYSRRDNPPNIIDSKSYMFISFACKYRYRLRHLSHLPVCCVRVRRLHDDVYQVYMPRCCRRNPPNGVTIQEDDEQ